MNINTTDKVQVGDSTAGTSTSTTWHCPYTQPRTEQGWECPRCGHINAPWVRQCNCSRDNSWAITSDWNHSEWWKDYIKCAQADDVTKNPNVYQVGGSDYKVGNIYENVSETQSNEIRPDVAWSCTNPNNCHTPHYATETHSYTIHENH